MVHLLKFNLKILTTCLEHSSSSESVSHHSFVQKDQGKTIRRPNRKHETVIESPSSGSDRRNSKNQGLPSNTGLIFTGSRASLNPKEDRTSYANPVVKTAVSNFAKNTQK